MMFGGDVLASLQNDGEAHALFSFTSIEAFRRWQFLRASNHEEVVYLVDFEFVGQSQSGLDIIEEMKIAGAAILVTSRYEEKSILQRCNKLGVKADSQTHGRDSANKYYGPS